MSLLKQHIANNPELRQHFSEMGKKGAQSRWANYVKPQKTEQQRLDELEKKRKKARDYQRERAAAKAAKEGKVYVLPEDRKVIKEQILKTRELN